MKNMFLAGLVAVSAGCFAEDGLSLADIGSASDEQVQKQIDTITDQAKTRQDSLDQLSDSLAISRSYRETEAERIAFEKARAALAKKPNARLGMTAKQVRTGTNWGEPDKVNDTIDASGSFQQWVYGDEYLYFKNGRLVSIQTSK